MRASPAYNEMVKKAYWALGALLIVGFLAGFLILGDRYNTSLRSTTPEGGTSSGKYEDTVEASPAAEVNTPPTLTPTPGIVLPPIHPNERSVRVPVLLYHYVSDNPNKEDRARDGLSTPPDTFKAQLATLKAAGYSTITFDELAAFFDGTSTLPSKPVILTFDDGYSDFYFNAYPILAASGMKGIAFISTGLIGGDAYMTWSQVEEIARSPAVVVGAHSVHHYVLTKSSSEVLKSELEVSKQKLEQHAGYPVNWVAYPYGTFDDRVVSAARSAGYVGAVTTLPGSSQYKSRLYHIPRFRAGRRVGEDLLRLIE